MNSAYNQIPLNKPSQRLTNFVIAGQQYCLKRIFYGISNRPTAFLSFLSSILNHSFAKIKLLHLDDVFIQDTTTETMLQTLDHHDNILKNENLKARSR